MTIRKTRLRFFVLPVIGILALLIFGCMSGILVPADDPGRTHDTAIRNETSSGLNLAISRFSWSHRPEVDRIVVKGEAINQTGKSIQAIRMIISVTDQKNRFLGTTETFLQPTYITPGKTVKFEFYINGDKKVTSIHLKYHFEARY